MDMELLFPSRYLKACDLQGRDVTVTILHVELSELTMRGGATKKRGVITLAKTEKAMVLNRTNGAIISSGQKREYLVYVPRGYDRAKPTPLVISMHGALL